MPNKKEDEVKPHSKEANLSVVFMGTSELSAAILESLIKKYHVIGIFTKPDTKVGRQHEEVSPLVKRLAEIHRIPVFQPDKFNDEAIRKLKELNPEMAVVAAYGKIIPESALNIPSFGFINVHASLLPKYRGPSPIQNSLINGETETGVTIMLMDKGVDTGDILAQEKMAISPEDNTKTLMEKFSLLGSDLLLKTISQWTKGKIKQQPQDNKNATSCKLIEREDGHINWNEDAKSIYNRYRALTPWPGIFSYWKNDSKNVRVKLISISLQEKNVLEKYREGEVFRIGNDIAVQSAGGIILIKEIQQEGKNKMKIEEFANGKPGFIGSILE